MIVNRSGYHSKAPLMWAIGGADPRAGAGIQADLQTANDLSVCCATIVTAVTAQSQRGVTAVSAVDAATLRAQLDTLLHDGEPRVIKIGLLCTQEQVACLAEWFSRHPVPLVLDPVIKASTGDALQSEAVDLSPLYRHCVLLTPNSWELERLGGIDRLRQQHAAAVLVTGQRRDNRLTETLHELQAACEPIAWQHSVIASKNDHGTGCCLASAIGAALACGLSLYDAITQAIAYVQHGLQPDAIANTRASVAHRGYPGRIALWPQVARDALANPPLSFPALKQNLGFYPVVDSLQWVEKLLALGVRTLQLRIKSQVETPALRQSIARAIELAEQADAQLFINDHWQLACEYGAYGVHLGQEDLLTSDLVALANCGLRLGISTHNLFEISVSLGIQPSYYALGHIFATKTKAMPGCPQGLGKLAQQARLLRDYPTVAIGGINRSNAEQVLATGVSGVAVVRAITESSNLRGTVQQFKQIFERFGRDANINSESSYASVG